MDKCVAMVEEALAGLRDGMTVLVGGWSGLGDPRMLTRAVVASRVRDLTLVNTGMTGLFEMIAAGQVRKVISSFASYADHTDPSPFDQLYREGRIELELVSQGTLAERIRAGGAGIPAFYTRATVGTPLAEGKPVADFDGDEYVLERAIRADFALIAADRGDRFGNLTYRRGHRNFNGPMAMAADVVVAEVRQIVPLGAIDPDHVVTSGVWVHRVIQRDSP
jgi:3-oxoadipate CoA-transferase alpha subunit